MLPPPDPIEEARQGHPVALLMRAMQRDVEGQRELIAARVRGETEAVYWEGNVRLAAPLKLPGPRSVG